MPTKLIPFTNSQESAFDELSEASPSARNVLTDAKGTVRRRPGITLYSEAPTTTVNADGIVGLYTTSGGKLFAVANGSPERPIYRVGSGAATLLGGGAVHSGLRGSARPTFAETPMLMVIAGGDRMQKVELDADISSELDGTGQPVASHIIANASRLLANQLDIYRDRIHWSGVATGTLTYAGHEVWSFGVGGAGFFTQEARPDPVVALAENTNEVWVWGSQTLQLFAPDPSTVYAPVAVLEHGCVAPYSVVKSDGTFFWLDDRRRFVMSSGRNLEVISDPIGWQLTNVTDPSSCFGYRVITGRSDVLVWTFPTDGRTFTFQRGAGWGQWQGAARGRPKVFGVTAHHLRRDTNVNVVGTSSGMVCRLSDTAGDDLGEPIVAEVVTGFLNRDTDLMKHCDGIRVTMRRDHHLGSPGQLLVSYRDSPADPWCADLEVELGTDPDPTVEFNSLGVYRYRQWRFRFSGAGEFTLNMVTERYEVEEAA